ncbi:MAG: hypothetical protein KTR32_26835 [Granulosicoccus sp.]|nr:hypothetical protein [Granulosicoccus sp.]
MNKPGLVGNATVKWAPCLYHLHPEALIYPVCGGDKSGAALRIELDCL